MFKKNKNVIKHLLIFLNADFRIQIIKPQKKKKTPANEFLKNNSNPVGC